MKVLWVCNTVLPRAAEFLNIEGTNKEGWIAGLAGRILQDREGRVQLAVACPMKCSEGKKKWLIPGKEGEKSFPLYGFSEDTDHPELYPRELAEELKGIIEDYEPEVIHCFGTEFPHTLALTKVCDIDRLLVGIQGVCGKVEEVYYADLPQKVVNRITFRDLIKKDSIRQQKEKFGKRSDAEKAVLTASKHVTGRTVLDREYSYKYNEKIHYHFMNETLRTVFYNGNWAPDRCEPYSMMISQGDYPLKGLHYVLKAMPEIMKKYPDTKLYVAGNPIVRAKNLQGALKISSYGKYIMELLHRLNLEKNVIFLGKLSAAEMKQRMLRSNVFVCASAAENSPNSLGEAMLLGVPCVTALVGGIPSIFRDGVDGIAYPGYGAKEYVNAQDKEQAQALKLAEAVLRMWEDKGKMSEYGRNASEHARVTHDGQKNFERLLEIYEEIVGN